MHRAYPSCIHAEGLSSCTFNFSYHGNYNEMKCPRTGAQNNPCTLAILFLSHIYFQDIWHMGYFVIFYLKNKSWKVGQHPLLTPDPLCTFFLKYCLSSEDMFNNRFTSHANDSVLLYGCCLLFFPFWDLRLINICTSFCLQFHVSA